MQKILEEKKGIKTMTTISLDKSIVTTINTFMVAPEQQQRALELLVEVATRISKTVPGFLSANFHRSVDGTRVVGYAQYTSIEAVQAGLAKILENAENPILTELREITSLDPRTYEVCAIVGA
jgi:quinol monooxygenase YgiN